MAAVTLAGMGATVLLTGRDRGRGETAVEEIRRRGGTAEFLQADFASLRAVRGLAAEVRSRHSRLDVLLNNAGGVNLERRLTPDGIEQTFAVNHLAAFLLTEELRDLLVASAPARVVTVSSEAHRSLQTLDFDNLQGERRYKPLLAYSISKLANVMFTYELDRRLRDRGVTANCVHPGVVNTGIWSVDSRLYSAAYLVGAAVHDLGGTRSAPADQAGERSGLRGGERMLFQKRESRPLFAPELRHRSSGAPLGNERRDGCRGALRPSRALPEVKRRRARVVRLYGSLSPFCRRISGSLSLIVAIWSRSATRPARIWA